MEFDLLDAAKEPDKIDLSEYEMVNMELWNKSRPEQIMK